MRLQTTINVTGQFGSIVLPSTYSPPALHCRRFQALLKDRLLRCRQTQINYQLSFTQALLHLLRCYATLRKRSSALQVTAVQNKNLQHHLVFGGVIADRDKRRGPSKRTYKCQLRHRSRTSAMFVAPVFFFAQRLKTSAVFDVTPPLYSPRE